MLDFNKGGGLIPAVVQDETDGTVLMLGYMNKEAYNATVASGKVTFFSRTKNRIWTKGETSGNFLKVVEISPDCDKDAILITAKPSGPVCHTGARACFQLKSERSRDFLTYLEALISERKDNPPESSYVSGLFRTGLNSIVQKVGEEAVELVIAAKDGKREDFLNEAADLLFHYLILLKERQSSLSDVIEVLKKRHKSS